MENQALGLILIKNEELKIKIELLFHQFRY
jgi:hypothetical protein